MGTVRAGKLFSFAGGARPATQMKQSTKVMLSAAAFAAALYGGFWAFGEWQVGNFQPQPIKPGKVTLVAVNTDLGFAIRVANNVAHLVQVDKAAGFEAPQKEGAEQDARRIPMRELLRSLEGDEAALSRLTMVLNRLNPDDLQPGDVVWEAADIQKAIDGDDLLKSKLQQDLNISLDGVPPAEVRPKSILNGIVVIVPVPIQVTVGGETKTLTARIPLDYQPQMAKDLAQIIEKRFNPSNEFIAGNYREVAKKYGPGKIQEDVAGKLAQMISSDKKSELSRSPEQVLRGALVLVNESMVGNVTTSTRKDDKGNDIYTIHLQMTEEGRLRLWKYSRQRKGSQLLVVVNGVAIAAPKITTELAGHSLDLTDLKDRRLVEDAVAQINTLKQAK